MRLEGPEFGVRLIIILTYVSVRGPGHGYGRTVQAQCARAVAPPQTAFRRQDSEISSSSQDTPPCALQYANAECCVGSGLLLRIVSYRIITGIKLWLAQKANAPTLRRAFNHMGFKNVPLSGGIEYAVTPAGGVVHTGRTSTRGALPKLSLDSQVASCERMSCISATLDLATMDLPKVLAWCPSSD